MTEFTPFPKSTNVDGAHYDAGGRVLTVKFRNGGSYTYADVPPHHWGAMRKADSVGGYLYKHIRGGFKSNRMEDKK